MKTKRNKGRLSLSKTFNSKRRLRMPKRRDSEKSHSIRLDKQNSRDSRPKKLPKRLRLNQRSKNSWLLKLSKRLSKPLLEELLPKQTLLDWREETNSKELKLKPNSSSSELNNKMKLKQWLTLKNPSKLQDLLPPPCLKSSLWPRLKPKSNWKNSKPRDWPLTNPRKNKKSKPSKNKKRRCNWPSNNRSKNNWKNKKPKRKLPRRRNKPNKRSNKNWKPRRRLSWTRRPVSSIRN